MPETKSKPKAPRRNLYLGHDGNTDLVRLARLLTPAGEEPNESMAVRVAVREALERRGKSRKKSDPAP
jgi:hypothetical protein